jgi:hypothetical protein
VAANENKQRIASELGADGVAVMEGWDRRIEEIGPNAAIEAARLYQAAPRLPVAEEETRNEGDHEASARAAYRQVAEKERREANMPAALVGLDRLEQRHGNLGVVDKFKRWDHSSGKILLMLQRVLVPRSASTSTTASAINGRSKL